MINTLKAVGDQLHHTLRCTNPGGLSITPAAQKIEAMPEEQPQKFFKSCQDTFLSNELSCRPRAGIFLNYPIKPTDENHSFNFLKS